MGSLSCIFVSVAFKEKCSVFQLYVRTCTLTSSHKVLREKQVCSPNTSVPWALLKEFKCWLCVIPHPMGCPIKASHPVNSSAHITTLCECSIWELGCVFLLHSVVLGSPMACYGSGALGLTVPHNRPCQRKPTGWLEQPRRVCGLHS